MRFAVVILVVRNAESLNETYIEIIKLGVDAACAVFRLKYGHRFLV